MKTKNLIGTAVPLALLLVLFFITALSACNPQSTQTATEMPTNESVEIAPTEPSALPTAVPEIALAIMINGFPYTFTQPPQIIGGTLWLPAGELFELLERQDINKTDTFISTADYNQDQEFINCHFSVGEKSYSPDTEGNIWMDAEAAPFMQNNEIYLTEKMIEDCLGEFIQFDPEENTISLVITGKETNPLQLENSNPISFYKLKDPHELTDSQIGALVSGCIRNPASDWMDWSKTLKDDGFSEARITLNASDGPAVDFDIIAIEQEIPPDYRNVYRNLKEMGIETRYSLNFWDLAYRQSGGKISQSRLSNEEEVERYLDYVRMVATSLKGLVGGYELWNEADANIDWYQRIDPDVYIEVAKRTIPIIREIDPQAKIVLLSTSSYIDQPVQEYSKVILESDILALADVISLHTVNNDASPVFKSDYYYGYDAMWAGIKKTAEEHGFSGEYYADELNYRSDYSLSALQPEPGEYHPYEPEIAAKYIARMIAANLGMDISVGTSGTNSIERPVEGKMIRNMAYLLDGLQAAPLPVTVQSESMLIRYYTFEDAAGDRYIVIWNDAEAKVNSEDVEASLVVKNVSADAVIAINPYRMNTQELNVENSADGLVIQDLLLKDYPVVYKIDIP